MSSTIGKRVVLAATFVLALTAIHLNRKEVESPKHQIVNKTPVDNRYEPITLAIVGATAVAVGGLLRRNEVK